MNKAWRSVLSVLLAIALVLPLAPFASAADTASGVSLSPSSTITLYYRSGATHTATVTATPTTADSTAYSGAIVWSLSDSTPVRAASSSTAAIGSQAYSSSTRAITLEAKAVGTTLLTATVGDSKTVSSFPFSLSKASLRVGETATASADPRYFSGDKATATYASSNTSVAKVSGSTITPKLHFNTYPVPTIRIPTLSSFIIDSHHCITLLTAIVQGKALRVPFPGETMLNTKIPETRYKVPFLCILFDPLNINNPAMVIISNIKPGNMQVVFGNEPEQISPFARQRGICFKIPAPLPGHLTANAHILSAVIMDRDIPKEKPGTVSVPALDLSPGAGRKTQRLNDFKRVMGFTGKSEPVTKNDILNRVFL